MMPSMGHYWYYTIDTVKELKRGIILFHGPGPLVYDVTVYCTIYTSKLRHLPVNTRGTFPMASVSVDKVQNGTREISSGFYSQALQSLSSS